MLFNQHFHISCSVIFILQNINRLVHDIFADVDLFRAAVVDGLVRLLPRDLSLGDEPRVQPLLTQSQLLLQLISSLAVRKLINLELLHQDLLLPVLGEHLLIMRQAVDPATSAVVADLGC